MILQQVTELQEQTDRNEVLLKMVEQQGRNNQGALESLKTLEENTRMLTAPTTTSKQEVAITEESTRHNSKIGKGGNGEIMPSSEKIQGIELTDKTLQGFKYRYGQKETET